MKRILFFAFMSLSLSQLALAEFTKGDGSFVATDDDGHEFVKTQLINEGFKSIITKEISKLGLNNDVFWKKYNDMLEEKYSQIEQQLKTQMKITDESSNRDKAEFERALRKKKLIAKSKFGKLYNVVPKYVVKKMSRSSKNGQYRYIKIEGEVNTQQLTKLYYSYVKGKKQSEYGTLYLNVKYNLSKFTYGDIGIENENDFEGVVTKNWLDWFVKNKSQNIANVEVLSSSNLSKLDDYLKLPSESMMTNIPEIFVNSLLLDIEVSMEKTSFNESTNEYTFSYQGEAYLRDLQTNLVLQTYSFNQVVKSYQMTKEMSLAKFLANQVYRLAKEQFPNIQNVIKELTPISSIQRVVLSNYENINEVNSFMSLVQSRGVKLSLQSKIESIGIMHSDLIMYYDGEITDLKSLLIGLQSAKKDLSFELIDTDNNLGIKFNRVTEKL